MRWSISLIRHNNEIRTRFRLVAKSWIFDVVYFIDHLEIGKRYMAASGEIAYVCAIIFSDMQIGVHAEVLINYFLLPADVHSFYLVKCITHSSSAFISKVGLCEMVS